MYHPVQPTASVPGETYRLATLHRDADILTTVLGGWSTRSIRERPETKQSFSTSWLPEGRAAAVPNTGSDGYHSFPPKKPGFQECVSERVLQAACTTHTLWFGRSQLCMHILRFTTSDNCALWNWKCIEYSLPTHFGDKEEIFILCLTELPSAFSSLNIQVIKISVTQQKLIYPYNSHLTLIWDLASNYLFLLTPTI